MLILGVITLGNVLDQRNLSRFRWSHHIQETFNLLLPQTVASHVVKQMTRYVGFEKFVMKSLFLVRNLDSCLISTISENSLETFVVTSFLMALRNRSYKKLRRIFFLSEVISTKYLNDTFKTCANLHPFKQHMRILHLAGAARASSLY